MNKQKPRRKTRSKPESNQTSTRLMQTALLVVVTLVVALAVTEVLLRVAFGGKYGPRPGFFIPDATLGWKCRPNLDNTFYGADFSIHVVTDSNGYRLGKLGAVDFGKRLVVFAGDSNVFGWGVSTAETCASYLDEMVSGASGGGARIVNLGVGSYGTFQYFFQIKNFIEQHPQSKIAAVLVLHAPNDAVDNVNSIGYHIGAWQVEDREPKTRSRLHVINLIAYAGEIIRGSINARGRTSDDAGSIHPYLRDMLFAFATKLPKKLPPEVVLNDRRISFRNVTEEDYLAEKTFLRENLTTLQRELMIEAINSIHLVLKDRDTRILHVVVPTAPDWFVDEVAGAVDSTLTAGDNRVAFLGRVLNMEEYEGQVLNDHKGGHYTPEFNRYWASRLMEALIASDVRL